uniref:DUF599 domain-containing protein n=1 Tax=Leersia perrieri TaxID=77586 RepID=A0A0D9X4I8_9ORYZ
MQRSSKELDYVLVPLGLAIMVSYHLWLLLRIRRRPATTVIGINAINRRIWVRHIMEEASGKHAVLAVQTMRNSIMASTVLASVAITLSSLVAALMASGVAHGIFSSNSGDQGAIVVGAGGETALSVKFFAILVCFLVAFLLNVQSIRYYSHTGILVNVPLHAHNAARNRRRSPGLAVDYVTATLNRGSYFWSLGVRAFYFSCPVFLWLFGPIPMFATCVAMVCVLYFLDVYTEWEKTEEEDELNGGDGDGDGDVCHEQHKTAAGAGAGRVAPQQDLMRKPKQQLDYVLVPLGLAIMVSYHLWLLHRIRRRPATTVIGINAINRRIWVRHIMEEASGKHAVLAVQTMRNSIMASTVLASVAITLSSLVAALMASGVAHGIFSSSSSNSGDVVVGATGETALSVKFFAILVCFLVAFLLNVQSIRYYSHTGFLVNVPLHAHRRRPGLAVDYVMATLNRGSYFWSLGVRAFYFSCPVFLWLFGPIPMFAACLAMVCALYFLDVYTEWDKPDDDEEDNLNGDPTKCHE